MDWTTKMSPPRTFSVISTAISPSLNVRISAVPSELPWEAQISCASGRFEFPANIFNTASHMNRPLRPRPRKAAGEAGFEPANAGTKTRCLARLGYSPSLRLLFPSRCLYSFLHVRLAQPALPPTLLNRTGYTSILLSFNCQMKSADYRRSSCHSRSIFLAPFLERVYRG